MSFKPVKRIEVENKHLKLRLLLAALAVVVAIAAFGYGIRALLDRNSGWQEVESYVDGVDCSSEFTFQYYFESSSGANYKTLSTLYTQALEEAYLLFYPAGGLAEINSHPNEAVEVEPALYSALKLIQSTGNRCLYLAPVYEEYDRVFLFENETEAERYDPERNEEIREYVAQIANVANDPQMINIELLGDNRVRLFMSDECVEFAAENGIESFLDFGWMRNAFIADHIADTFVSNGYTKGFIASYDGFTRNLDTREEGYSFNLFDRLDKVIYCPAVMEYTGPMSIVYLRNYPISDADRWHYFGFSDGKYATAFVSPETGLSASSTDNLVAYSQRAGCAEIMLKISHVFLADELDESKLELLTGEEIDSVWFEDVVLKHTESSLAVTATKEAQIAGYKIP